MLGRASLQAHKKGFGSAKKSAFGLTICTLILFSLVLTLFSFTPSVKAETLGAWNATTSYPFTVEGNSCAISGGYIYCVGGGYPVVNSTYYAPISSSGIGAWTNTTDYPTPIYFPSCAISGGYIYCVGGLVAPGTQTNAVYYAPISSSGIGTWTNTTAYPTTIEVTTCDISGGYITCVGGLVGDETNTNAVNYAAVSSGGIGTWTPTTNYPTDIQATGCVISGGYMTCVGGIYNPTEEWSTNATYSDTVSLGALGASWTPTTEYPVDLSFEPCATYAGYIYCGAGYSDQDVVYYGLISSGVVSSWTATTAYPGYPNSVQCGISGGYMYCVGGDYSAAYYSAIESSVTSTTTASTTTTTTTTTTASTNITETSTFTTTYLTTATVANTTTTETVTATGTATFTVIQPIISTTTARTTTTSYPTVTSTYTTTRTGSNYTTTETLTTSYTTTQPTTTTATSYVTVTTVNTTTSTIPEFPAQFGFTLLVTVVIAMAYVFARHGIRIGKQAPT